MNRHLHSSAVTTTAVPIAEGLFTWPSDEPRLLGGRCRACATVTFPFQVGCPACAVGELDQVELARRGTLWTFTTQAFPVKDPYLGPSGDDFAPFAVGYVELGDVRVEGRLAEADPARLAIGMQMETVVVPFRDAEGHEVMTYAFQPVGTER